MCENLNMRQTNLHPYYIIAPPYIRTSAGARVLYKLADLINKCGGSAYIHLRPYSNLALAGSPMDIAPFLTQKNVDYHFQNGLTPIVIYPETLKIKKFSPPISVRYLLNYDGLLSKNDPLTQDDYLLSYSKSIEESIENDIPTQTLFLPVSDPVFFCPPAEGTIRKGACFYAGKYKYAFNGKTFPVTEGLTEITRDLRNSQTPDEIKRLFQTSEWFYCYEDSALALESMLSGCPVIFLPNEHFKKSLGSHELKGLGYAWGDSEEQRGHARKSVGKLRGRYLELLNESQEEALQFIEKTQSIAQKTPYTSPFLKDYPIHSSPLGWISDVGWFIIDSYLDLGIRAFFKVLLKRIRAGRIRFIRS